MNHKHPVAISVLIICCIGLIVLLVYRVSVSRTNQTSVRPSTEQTTKPEVTPTPQSKPVSLTNYKDLIEIISPLPNAAISRVSSNTKFLVKGRARGPWFFEGTFPVQLVNSVGDYIATGVAHAEGEWMTMDYVSFTAELTWVSGMSSFEQTGNIGALILKKDNPSGDPEKEDEFDVLVQFVP